MRYFLKIAFLGTRFSGWQKQINASSVQDLLELHISDILGYKVSTMGAGRTDAGVHAKGMMAHFDTEAQIPQHFLVRLNHLLPPDVAITKILIPKKTNAHARFDALSRNYTYSIHFDKDPFIAETSLKVRPPLNRHALIECARLIKEAKDFSAFAKAGSEHKSMNCNILRSEWEFQENQWFFHIQADRFLRGMVRLLTGNMLKIARGRSSMKDFETMLYQPENKKGGPSADPHGLTFTGVTYPEDYFYP